MPNTRIVRWSLSEALNNADEDFLRNYLGRVGFGFFLVAFLGYVTTTLGDLSQVAGAIWVSATLGAYFMIRLIEGLIMEWTGKVPHRSEKSPLGHGNDEPPHQNDSHAPENGHAPSFLGELPAGRVRCLESVETPEGVLDALLVVKEGALALVQRSSMTTPLPDNTETNEDWTAALSEADELRAHGRRVAHVIAGIPGPAPLIHRVLLVPPGSCNGVLVEIHGVHFMPIDMFPEVVANHIACSEHNRTIWRDYRFLRPMIRG